MIEFESAFVRCPLIAILRGLRPEEAEAVGEALVGAGFTLIETPLNSPDPLASIARLAQSLAGRAVVGAGTVLSAADVSDAAAAGAVMMVSPNTNPAVIRATVERSLISLPGVFTASEAFAALEAGATALKLFPAEGASPALLKALRAVLPSKARVIVVGGVTPQTLSPWLAAGAAGFGIGSALFTPGMTAEEVGARARSFVEAWRAGGRS